MRDAIVVALHREAEGSGGKKTKKLTLIANALVDKACAGDVSAIKEVGDRVDGKPAQAIVGDPERPLEQVIRWAKADSEATPDPSKE